MNSNLLSFDARAVRRASISLLGAALLAACDTDRAVSPIATATPAQVPTSASPIVKPVDVGSLAIKVFNTQNVNIGLAQFQIVGPQFNATVTDNAGLDTDAGYGIVRLINLKVGSYSICEIVAPVSHALANPACQSATVFVNGTTGVDFINPHLPWLRAGFINVLGAHVGGGTVTIKDSVGASIAVVADQSPLDGSDDDERIAFLLPSAGKFSICGTTAPVGFALAPNQAVCLTATVQLATVKDAGDFLIHPTRSLSWDVRDGFAALIGPSTFNVSSSKLLVSFNVVDNGANDLDPAVGKFLVQLPKSGLYTVCETVPPPNRYNAKPACVRIDASSGQPMLVGTFVNYEKQVFNP
jgi:hypothetical protein